MYSLLDTYTLDEVFNDAETTLRDIRMARTDAPMTFAVRMMKPSLRFGLYSSMGFRGIPVTCFSRSYLTHRISTTIISPVIQKSCER